MNTRRKRRIIITDMRNASVIRLATHGTKRVRAKYRNAITCSRDGAALALTDDGFGVVALLLVGWFTMRLESRFDIVNVESVDDAISRLRTMPLVLMERRP